MGLYSTKGGYILSFLRKERFGEKGGAFFNGKEGRDDFRKTAPEGGYILSLRARERLGEKCGILLGRRN